MAFVARVLALVVALSLALPVAGLAAGKRQATKEVLTVCRRAEKLLDKLEYERGRELLESSVRNPRYRRASPPSSPHQSRKSARSRFVVNTRPTAIITRK